MMHQTWLPRIWQNILYSIDCFLYEYESWNANQSLWMPREMESIVFFSSFRLVLLCTKISVAQWLWSKNSFEYIVTSMKFKLDPDITTNKCVRLIAREQQKETKNESLQLLINRRDINQIDLRLNQCANSSTLSSSSSTTLLVLRCVTSYTIIN